MQVFHTCGVPPSLGRIILPIIGWTRKRMKALTKSVAAYRGRAKGLPPWQNETTAADEHGGAVVPYETTFRQVLSNTFLQIEPESGETHPGANPPSEARSHILVW